MKNTKITLSLFINYFVFAILLNSVGTVILQVQNNFQVGQTAASVLEACKDLSIAALSFFAFSFFNRLGYKKAMLLALGVVSVVCMLTPSFASFGMTEILFIAVGASFALIKMSVYGTIGLITDNEKEHISLMNFLESFFMIGILSGNFLFSFYVKNNPNGTDWFSVYYVLGGLSLLAFLLLWTSPLDESSIQREEAKNIGNEFSEMLTLLKTPIVLVFVVCAFFYVLMEQSIMSWLPTFNQDVLKLSTYLSIQMASMLALFTALGRFLAGIVMRKIEWYTTLTICLILSAVLVLIAIPMAQNADGSQATTWLEAPIATFIFPLIGLLIAPIYPAINSLILNTLPKYKHGLMSSLIIVFSALGGTTGSLITGRIFETLGGQKAFYFSLLPIVVLLISLYFFKKLQAKS